MFLEIEESCRTGRGSRAQTKTSTLNLERQCVGGEREGLWETQEKKTLSGSLKNEGWVMFEKREFVQQCVESEGKCVDSSSWKVALEVRGKKI